MAKKVDVKHVEVDKAKIPKVYVNPKNTNGPITGRWWVGDEAKLHERVFSLVESLERDYAYRQKKSVFNAQIYENEALNSMTSRLLEPSRNAYSANKISLNVCKSGIDTLTAKIGTLKPKPYFLTKKGHWDLQQKARKCSLYIEGCFQTEKLWRKGRRAFRDAGIFGSGFIKCFRYDGKVRYERVLESEIIVDELEAMYGEPRSLHQKRHFPREVLAGMFPKHLGLINAAPRSTREKKTSTAAYNDMIEVIESWHLPSSAGAKDGIRCWSIKTGTLFHESWERSYFPFAKIDFSEPVVGFFGRGVPDELRGIQLEINKLLRTVALAMHKVAVPTTWLDWVNKDLVHRITNEVGGVNFYKGRPPITATPSSMPPEVYAQIERLYYKGLEAIGVSQMSAGGKRAPGLNSEPALRTAQAIESERFTHIQQAYEEMYLDLAIMTIDETEQLAKELKEENRKLIVKVGSKKEMRTIEWEEVRLAIDEYMIQLWPTNLLPSQPEALVQRVQEMMQAGFFSQEEAAVLLDFPDIEGVISLRTAGRDAVLSIIGQIMDGDGYPGADPALNLDFAEVMAHYAYLQALTDKAPDQITDQLSTFRQDVKALKKRRDDALIKQQAEAQAAAMASQQAAAPAAGPSSGPPLPDAGQGLPPELMGLAQPESAPVSDLLPLAQ